MGREAKGLWINPDGSSRPAQIKGGPLFDAFHGIRRGDGRELGASQADLARAYASAVWAYRCVKVRADAVASVPLMLLDREGAPIADHAVLRLLKDVNPFTMNLGDLLRATEAAYNIWGVAYWLKVAAPQRSSPQLPVKWLVWLNPQTVEAVVDSVKGVTGYKQTVGSETRLYAPEEVIAFRNFHPLDDLGGLSPLSVILDEVNAELNVGRFVAAFFANDARPAGLLTTDEKMSVPDTERVRTWWERLFMGASNKWKTGIVGSGLRWQSITFPMADLALTDLRAEDRRSICAAFGVPAALAGAWEAATYASAREQKASFYEDTIIPQLEYLAEVLNWSLLPHYPDLVARDARLAWDVDSITALRESANEKAQRFTMLYQAGIISRDEVRVALGMTLDEAEKEQAIIETAEKIEEETADVGAEDLPPGSNDRAQKRQNGQKPADKGSKLKARLECQRELARWRRFATNRLSAGKAIRAFESAIIPAEVRAWIEEELAKAKDIQTIRAIFSEVMRPVTRGAVR